MILELVALASIAHGTAFMKDPVLMQRAQTRAEQLCSIEFTHANWKLSFDGTGLENKPKGENLACAGKIDPHTGMCVKKRGVFTKAETVHSAWMRSTSHRANIVNPKFNRIGIGQSSCGVTVQLFAQ